MTTSGQQQQSTDPDLLPFNKMIITPLDSSHPSPSPSFSSTLQEQKQEEQEKKYNYPQLLADRIKKLLEDTLKEKRKRAKEAILFLDENQESLKNGESDLSYSRLYSFYETCRKLAKDLIMTDDNTDDLGALLMAKVEQCEN
jgi:hypothetical protein